MNETCCLLSGPIVPELHSDTLEAFVQRPLHCELTPAMTASTGFKSTWQRDAHHPCTCTSVPAIVDDARQIMDFMHTSLAQDSKTNLTINETSSKSYDPGSSYGKAHGSVITTRRRR